MKKIIIIAFGFIFLFAGESAMAQITGTGKGNLPVRTDTLKKPSIPTGKRDTDTLHRHRKDSVWHKRTEAERKSDSLKWRKRIDSTAKAVGDKTTQVGAKVVATIKDRSLKNVKGPRGETVYVDKYDRRYYINKEGKKVYLKKPKSPTQK